MEREKIMTLSIIIVSSIPYFFIDVKSLILPAVIYPAILMIRFLSGFGIFSSYAIFVVYLLKYLSDFFKKKKRESELLMKIINILAIVILIALIVQSIVTWSSEIGFLSLFIGISLFIVSMYIAPIWKEEKIDESLFDKVKNFVVKGIKKEYYKYFTKEYLKAYSIEYLTFRAKLDAKRKKLALLITPLLVLLAIPLAPLIIIILYFSYKLYKEEVSTFDRYLFIVGLIIIIAFQLIILQEITIPAILWNLPYLIGTLISFYIYFRTIIK